MELSLKYNEHAMHALKAAFVRGNTPDIWLQEMNAWQIPLAQLVCFIISNNNNPNEAAGLFVIFGKGQTPGLLQVKQPYTVLGGKLYIPVDAELAPAITEQELQSLLIWEYQIFHPTIGFTGFERSDRISLTDLIEYTEPRNINWEYAQAGHSPWIPLHQINVQKLSAEEIFDSIKDAINSKPLTDIPKSNKKEVPGWLNNPVAAGLLKGTFSLLKGLGALGGIAGMMAGAGGGTTPGRSARPPMVDGKPGLFGRMMNWMQEKIEDLEKQRDSELKRLSEMFEKNMDEALQYAIPLSSPYMNRGSAATPSARLSKRSSQFNLGNLGGGQAIDGWNMDNYYDELRRKYLDAAHQAIAKKDHKKAAYVYAHLLGDYATAANTLKQGKHYREAAALYKDHLRNPYEAAFCYEEGGLYNEAIELYTETNHHEKAGDLYMQLDQKERAVTCYEKSVEKAALNKDYLEQSRIITNKIGDRPRAKQVLLTGWRDVKRPEACLTKYFDLFADDNKEQLHSVIKAFYESNEVVNKKLSFLNVIDDVNKKYRTNELESTCRSIAYEVISEEVGAGDAGSVNGLMSFITDDRLLGPDCYRFIHTTKKAPEQSPVSNGIQLMEDAAWDNAVAWQNQLLVWGLKSSGLILARISGDGQVEYFNWNAESEMDAFYLPLADPENTNNIVLYTHGMAAENKRLPKNNYFQDELSVFQPQFLHENVVGVGMHDGDVFTLHVENEEAFLNSYSLTGELKISVRCSFTGEGFRATIADTNEMIWCDGYFYQACDNMVYRISESGEIDVLYYLQGLIKNLAVYKQQNGVITIGFSSGYRAFFMNSDDDYKADPFEVREDERLIMDIAILPGNRYVMADEKKVRIYNDMEGNRSPELYWQFDAENEVAAVFQGAERNQLGIVEKNGQITFHVIN
jgi:tetratricopeptide (TPR) repeat protein